MKMHVYLLVITVALTGCAGSVKEVACTGQNWAGFGYKMGAEGRSVHEFDDHRSSCGRNLEKGALKAYLDGYTRGIIEYCTYDNGYTMGSKNQSISENCPLELRGSYTKGYNIGKIEFAEKMRQMQNQVDDAESRQHKSQNERAMNSTRF